MPAWLGLMSDGVHLLETNRTEGSYSSAFIGLADPNKLIES